MAVEIHQALYGYSDGHSLLAASQRLDPRATRELRTFTDLAFDGVSDSYLTCIPIARAQPTSADSYLARTGVQPTGERLVARAVRQLR